VKYHNDAITILLTARGELIREQIKALETERFNRLFEAWKTIMHAIEYVERQDIGG
jgi:hypothetical protein